MRLKSRGLAFFYDPSELIWNWLDFVIVFSGVVDQWLMPIWELINSSEQGGHQLGQMMMLMRMLRLMRILRLLRLVKALESMLHSHYACFLMYVICLVMLIVAMVTEVEEEIRGKGN